MNYSDEIWAEEKRYLKDTLEMIKEQIHISRDKAENYKDNIVKAQKSMWDERSMQADPSKEIDGAAIAWQHQEYMLNEAKSMQFFSKMASKLELMQKRPYFARIDFDEEGESLESYYIGMGKLSEDDFSNIRIYDWRAPICSMFYNYEIGPATYDCPMGEIKGQLTLKRQYKIADHTIEYMFDSGLKINDEMLQEILGRSTDDKMKTIVTSIQKEQNLLIRDESHDLLMIQGAAGSGKTSIALHRIAYILYRQRSHISASNMVIFSPNEVFNDYISNVLPELGEENVHLTTFNDYLDKILEHKNRVEDWNSQMEHILSRGAEKVGLRRYSVEHKTSNAFIEVLKSYVSYLKEEGFGFQDIWFEDTCLITANALRKMYRKHQEILSPRQSLNRIRIRLHKQLDPLLAAKEKALKEVYDQSDELIFEEEMHEKLKADLRESFKNVRSQINALTKFDVKWLYRALFKFMWLQKKLNGGKALFSKDLSQYTVRHLDSGYLFYEDALSLAWLKGALEGVTKNTDIKHVVIDEAQDYSLIHYEIFVQLFPKANFTLLGDVNQSVNPYMATGNHEHIFHTFGAKTYARMTLKRSYRSSKKIAAFCRGLLAHEDQTIYLDREGNDPVVKDSEDEAGMYVDIHESVRDFCGKGNQSVAIICKTENASIHLHSKLDEGIHAHLLTRKDIHYKQGVVVLPSYLAKGLEFDAVLVCCNGKNNYTEEEERNLFYTVCSRALHELEILYTGEKPLWLND